MNQDVFPPSNRGGAHAPGLHKSHLAQNIEHVLGLFHSIEDHRIETQEVHAIGDKTKYKYILAMFICVIAADIETLDPMTSSEKAMTNIVKASSEKLHG